jgi:septum formation inhibitor MinC
MISSLKLNSAHFNYYLLSIGKHTKLEQVATKLASLRGFDPHAKYLVISFEDLIDLPDLEQKLHNISNIATGFGLKIQCIQANTNIVIDKLSKWPVVDLPATLKPQLILNQPLVVSDPVRSGMKVENDGDIVITNLVSHNAEVIASGNIYIYGDCRGRLFAGCSGNKQARIFVTRFNPELISIAGIFRVLEDKLPEFIYNQATQVFLDDKGRLSLTSLTHK